MSRKTPDKREQNRLKKIEAEKQSKRMRTADMVMRGYSLRKAAAVLKISHQFVANYAKRLLDKAVLTIKGKKIARYRWKKGLHSLTEYNIDIPPKRKFYHGFG